MSGLMATVGPKTREKLLKAFGSEEEVERAARNLELDRFLSIRGVSPRKAVSMISRVLGLEEVSFLRTPAAEAIYDDIVRRIQGFAHTSYARNKALLLRPLREVRSRETMLSKVMAAKERARQLPRETIGSILKGLPRIREPKPVFDSSKVVVVDDPKTLDSLSGFTRYCEILMPEDLERPEEYDLIVYVSTSGSPDFDGLDQVHVVLGRPEPWQLFPESVLDFYRSNEALLRAMSELSTYVAGLEVAEECLTLLRSLRVGTPAFSEDEVGEVLERLNEDLRERLTRLSLEGPEVIELLQKGLPSRLREVFDEVLEEAENELLRRTGLHLSLEPSYPLRLPEEELERALRDARRRAKQRSFEAMLRAARALLPKEDQLREAYRRVLEFDFELAIGSFALEYDLQPPHWGNEVRLKGALHLDLIHSPEAQRVDYYLPASDGVSLLTGANSGGKTTLLETIAQVYILATMGLPVNAREAILEPVDALYFFSRQRSLSAGALEGFLTTFMPLAMDASRKIVLADELEAMTEPEAAAAIVAAFLEELKRSESYAVVVTHAARSIMKLADVRVDGIEAQGLDENYNLIVDRTPKRNLIARSTPELILQRLMAIRKGSETGLYGKVLERLRDQSWRN